MRYYEFGCKLLMAIGVGFFGIGIFIVFFNNAPWFIVNKLIDPLFWKEGIIPGETERFKIFAYGYIGMLNALWGLYIFFVAKFALLKRGKWAWMCIGLSILLWFLLDTWFSLSVGLYINVIINIIVLVMFSISLNMTKSVLKTEKSAI